MWKVEEMHCEFLRCGDAASMWTLGRIYINNSSLYTDNQNNLHASI